MNIETIIIKPKDSDMLRISVEEMDLPLCQKIGDYVVYCSQYGRWKCPYSCLYATKRGIEEINNKKSDERRQEWE